MPVKYSIALVNSIVEVRVSGVADRESVTEMWTSIASACEKHQCNRILGFSNLERSLDLSDALEHDQIFVHAGIDQRHQIAWMQLNPATRVMTDLSATVARNKKITNIESFADEAEARRWLDENN